MTTMTVGGSDGRGRGSRGPMGPAGPAGAAGAAGAQGPSGLLDCKSIGLPAITLLAAGSVREYTVTWASALPNATYGVKFLPDAAALAPFTFALKAGSRTTTQCVIQVTNNSLLTLGASVVHVIATN